MATTKRTLTWNEWMERWMALNGVAGVSARRPGATDRTERTERI